MKFNVFKLRKSKFVKNVAIMATGAAGAQAITMALSPFITRIYGPEAFGVLGTFNALVNIIVPISALTYPIAIVLPKSNQDGKGLMRLSLLVTSIITLISLLLIMFFSDVIISIFNLTEISSFLYLIPIIILLSGLMQVFEQWLIRTKQFTINARATFYHSIVINFSKVGIGYFYPFASVLVVLTAIGNGIRALLMVFFSKRVGNKYKGKNTENKKNLLRLAKEYYEFPLYRAPEVFLNSISNGLPVLMLTAFFGPASAGFYTIGRTVLSIPSRLVGKAIGDVFYPRAAEAVNKKQDISKLIKKSTLGMIAIGILPFGIIILFGPYLFSFVFGADWVTSGEYARWIALWAFSSFINRPSVRSLAVLNALKFHLLYSVIGLFVRVLSMIAGFYIFASDLIAVILFGISGTILNLALITLTVKISERKFASKI